MKFSGVFVMFFSFIAAVFCISTGGVSRTEIEIAENADLNELMNVIRETLDSDAYSRQYGYLPGNKGISLGVYEALKSIARNDDLECVSRLLCEAAAGGKPGYSGKQLQFDKASLTKLISYLSLDGTGSSPLLVFGRAALLGVSHRGDPYSCIINYPKCPKDQGRLLYYLNNHRGGFFQYFDKKYQNQYYPGQYYPNQYYTNQYRPYYTYQKYQTKYKRNKVVFQNFEDLKDSFRKKATSNIYAKKHRYEKYRMPMVFPEDKDAPLNPRILTNAGGLRVRLPNDFHFDSVKYPKAVKNFFPEADESAVQVVVSDRLPPGFHFPLKNNNNIKNSFFPES